jgi:phytoene synthase
MSFDVDLTACAALVEKADPDRFAAAMAGPLAARRILFPLYAFNVEISRAPWVTQEAMIAEMRLQWWRDALEEIAESRPARRHEVVTPMAAILAPDTAKRLDRAVAARRWDIYRDPFENDAHFQRYLQDTAGLLTWAAAHSLGAPESACAKIVALGSGAGLARFLQAIPELEARGRVPLLDGRPDAIADLARTALEALPALADLKTLTPRSAWPALTETCLAEPLLQAACKNPSRVASGSLNIAPLRRTWRLWRWS